MKGFFDHTPQPTRSARARLVSCGSCGLHKNSPDPKLKPEGKGRLGILCLAEAPGNEKARRYLDRSLEDLGIDLEEDCWLYHAVNCVPKVRKTPTGPQMAACRDRVWKAITELKPKLILALGPAAVTSLLAHRWKKDQLGGIDRWRGWTPPDREARAWICPIYDPGHLLRNRNSKGGRLGMEVIFKKDLKHALLKLDEPLPWTGPIDEWDCLENITDEKELNEHLIYLGKLYQEEPHKTLSIDLETTGLKPYLSGHRIVSCALSHGPNDAVAFPWPKEKMAKKRLAKLLGDSRIRKIAQNLPYEDRWLTHFEFPVEGWYWDTLLASHLLDNRPKVTGLKFQAYVQFGLLGYDDEVGVHLRPSSEDKKKYGANAKNRIEEIWKTNSENILTYNAMDALLTHRLADQQIAEVDG